MVRAGLPILIIENTANLLRLAWLTLLALMVLNIVNYFYHSAIYSIVAVAIFGVYVIKLSRYCPAAFVLLLVYLFFRFTTLISGVAIELGSEMQELDTWGKATGSTIRLCMVYIAFITAASAVIEAVHIRIRKNSNLISLVETSKWVPVFFILVSTLTLVMIMKGTEVGFPMFSGMSRLAFREEISSKLFLLYISNRPIFVALLGLVFATCTGFRRKASLALFMVTMLVSMLFGEKFTSLIILLVFMSTPSLLLSKQLHSLRLTRLAVPMLLATMLTIPFILLVYGWNDDPVAAVERLTSRFSGQGQLWFVADRDINSFFLFDQAALLHNLKSFVALDGGALSNQYPFFGARYFMYNYMNTDLLFLFLETKALTLTFGFEPYILVTNGWLGQLLPLVLCAAVYALNLAYLNFAIFNANPVSIFLSMKLFIWFNFALQQGELWFMFGLKSLILVSLCVIYERFISGRRLKLYG